MQPMLSTYICTVLTGVLVYSPYACPKNRASQVASWAAKYSASQDDVATKLCLPERHEIRADWGLHLKTYPETDCLSESFAQSESEYP